MKTMKRVTRTKRPMVHATFRLKREEREVWREGARKLGESLNEFVRVALMDRGKKILFAAARDEGGRSDQNAA
jgi:hypothetical protein